MAYRFENAIRKLKNKEKLNLNLCTCRFAPENMAVGLILTSLATAKPLTPPEPESCTQEINLQVELLVFRS